MSDLVTVALITKGCLRHASMRSVGFVAVVPSGADTIWNRVVRSLGDDSFVGSESEAAAMATLYLTYATGYLIGFRPEASRAGGLMVRKHRPSGLQPGRPLNYAAYKYGDYWEVSGELVLGDRYRFVIRFTGAGSVESLFLRRLE